MNGVTDIHCACPDYLERKAANLGLQKLFLLTTRTADWSVPHSFGCNVLFPHECLFRTFVWQGWDSFSVGLYNGDLQNVGLLNFLKRGKLESTSHGAPSTIWKIYSWTFLRQVYLMTLRTCPLCTSRLWRKLTALCLSASGECSDSLGEDSLESQILEQRDTTVILKRDRNSNSQFWKSCTSLEIKYQFK